MLGGNSLNDDESVGVDDAGGDPLSELAAVAKAVGRNDDSYTRQLMGEAVILQTLSEPTISRINAQMRNGRLPESAASILRLMAGLTGFRLREISMAIAGTQGVLHGAGDPAGALGQRWLSARISTVGGGSQEMQRNGISERVLGLPREATPDRGVPFSEVLASRRRNAEPGR
jgi:alkylation response protein AidB-like acyl-CoA dehydrogenase